MLNPRNRKELEERLNIVTTPPKEYSPLWIKSQIWHFFKQHYPLEQSVITIASLIVKKAAENPYDFADYLREIASEIYTNNVHTPEKEKYRTELEKNYPGITAILVTATPIDLTTNTGLINYFINLKKKKGKIKSIPYNSEVFKRYLEFKELERKHIEAARAYRRIAYTLESIAKIEPNSEENKKRIKNIENYINTIWRNYFDFNPENES